MVSEDFNEVALFLETIYIALIQSYVKYYTRTYPFMFGNQKYYSESRPKNR